MDRQKKQTPRPRPAALDRRGRAVQRLATRQGGVIGHAALQDLGLSRATILQRTASGSYIDLGAGVFAIGHRAVSDDGRKRAALIAAGAGSMLSHWTAAFLWGLIKTDPKDVHVSIPTRGTRRRCERVVFHRPRELPEADCRRRRGFALTSLERTLLDLSPLIEDGPLRRAIEAAITRHRLDPLRLRAYARAAGNRPGSARLRRACEQVAGPARLRSELEAAFRTFCEDRGLPPYEANVAFQRWELDVYWRLQGVAAELDWYRYHGAESNYRRDRKKGLALQAAGIGLVRIAGEDLEEDPDEVYVAVQTILGL